MDESAIRGIRVSLGLLWLLVIASAIYLVFVKLGSFGKFDLRLNSEGATYSLHGDDGPYVVFGFAAYGDHSEKRWATLDPPIAIIDSGGAVIDSTKLRWHDVRGEPASAPTTQEVIPLYIRPEHPEPRQR